MVAIRVENTFDDRGLLQSRIAPVLVISDADSLWGSKVEMLQERGVYETGPEHLYAATRSAKLYESHDSGDTWEKRTLRYAQCFDMKCVQVNAKLLLAE
jgi:predicted P-loop ATPase